MSAKRNVRPSVRRGTTVARKPQRQPRVKGIKRIPGNTAVLPIINEYIQREMQTYGVSRSYVHAVCAVIALGVPVDPELLYRSATRPLRVIRGGRR